MQRTSIQIDQNLQRAAVEAKMGPSNFTYEQQKLMAAYREFLNHSEQQKSALREAENKYFKTGEPLSEQEQTKLDSTRTIRRKLKQELKASCLKGKQNFQTIPSCKHW